MPSGPEFPAFIKAVVTDDGSFPKLEAKVADAMGNIRQRVEVDAAAVERTIRKALTAPSTPAGTVNLNTGQFEEAARRADVYARQLRMVATAAESLATSQGHTSASTQRYIAITQAAARQAELTATATNEEATAMVRLQRELSELPGLHRAATVAANAQASAMRAVGAGVSANNFAMMQLGQQAQDFAIQIAAGQRPLTAFAQQASQAGFILGTMGGSASRVARIFANPWFTAVMISVSAVDFLTRALRENTDAAEEASQATEDFAREQLDVATFFDRATGAIREQNAELRTNAILKAADKVRDLASLVGTKERGAFAAVRKAADETVPDTFVERGLSVRNFDPDIVAALGRANGDIRKLDAALGDLVRTRRPELRDLWKQVNEAAAFARYAVNKADERSAFARSLATGELDQQFRRGGGGRDTAAGASRQADRLADFGDETASRIANIVSGFSDAPSQVEKVTNALFDLDQIAAEVERKRPPNYQQLLDQIAEARPIIQHGLVEPLDEFVKKAAEQSSVQQLINSGRQTEAAILETILRLQEKMGPLTKAQKQTVIDTALARERDAEAAARAAQQQQKYVAALAGVQQDIVTAFSGLRTDARGAIGGLFKDLGAEYDKLFGSYLEEKLFGRTFDDLMKEVTGKKSPFDTAVEHSGTILEDLNVKLRAFGSALGVATGSLPGGTSATDPKAVALDAAAAAAAKAASEIVVTGTRYQRSPGDFLGGVVGQLVTSLTKHENETAAEARKRNEELADKIGDVMNTVFNGIAGGQIAGGLILGGSGDRTGEAIGGVVGNVAGKAIGSMLGKLGGSIGGPIGSAVGGVLGGLVGGLFGGNDHEASSTLIINNQGAYGAAPIGEGSKERSAAQSLANDLGSALERIAEQLGGTLGRASVSVGYRPGHKAGPFRVDPTGRGGVAGGPVVAFENEEDAIRYAIIDALKDGAIEGIREGTKRLLRAGHDLDTALQKALSFQQVFADLKRFENPVGAAIDDINTKFSRLKAIFKEAGASAEEYADLEKLYGYERADAIKQASAQALDSLKSLLHDVTIGDSGKSLRDRIAAAKAVYDPLAADLGAGKAVDYDAFAGAARDLLDVTRQYSGSQSDYFALLDEVTGLTQQALTAQQGALDAATGSGTPFDTKPIVDATDRSAQTIVDGLADRLGPRLDAVNDNLGRLLMRGTGTSGLPGLELARLNY